MIRRVHVRACHIYFFQSSDTYTLLGPLQHRLEAFKARISLPFDSALRDQLHVAAVHALGPILRLSDSSPGRLQSPCSRHLHRHYGLCFHIGSVQIVVSICTDCGLCSLSYDFDRHDCIIRQKGFIRSKSPYLQRRWNLGYGKKDILVYLCRHILSCRRDS